MMNHNHLSTAEVALFRVDADSPRSIEIGRHLLICKECRAKLPAVSSQEFLNCILDSENLPPSESEHSRRLFDVTRFPTLSIARATVFAGFAILLVVGVYFVADKTLNPTETTIARSDDNARGTDFSPIPRGSVAVPNSGEQNQATAKDPVRSDAATKSASPKNNQGRIRRVAAKVPEIRNAETRGNENPCSNGATINLESNSDGKEIVLKWNAVKRAASYAIYIADLDENLVDHFESKTQTYYRSNVILEPAKSYRWKLIITLKNGNRIVGPPQVLRLGATTTNSSQSGVEKQRASVEMRCIAAK